jgi:hypothetical protein
LEQSSFDWNEVRVTTTMELIEWMAGVVDARQAAINLKRFLHSVFESQYSFELDTLKKQNLGKAQADLAKFTGASPFAISYVTQHALSGHALPLRSSAYDVLYIVGILDQKERAAKTASRIERAIPKKSGVEFGALLHQLAIDLAAAPFSTRVRSILLEVNPDAKDRLPKRPGKKPPVPPPTPEEKPAKKLTTPAAPAKSAKPAKAEPAKAVSRPVARKAATKKGKPVPKKVGTGKAAGKNKPAKKPPARKKSPGPARVQHRRIF